MCDAFYKLPNMRVSREIHDWLGGPLPEFLDFSAPRIFRSPVELAIGEVVRNTPSASFLRYRRNRIVPDFRLSDRSTVSDANLNDDEEVAFAAGKMENGTLGRSSDVLTHPDGELKGNGNFYCAVVQLTHTPKR